MSSLRARERSRREPDLSELPPIYARALRAPPLHIRLIDKIDCEQSLATFVQRYWRVLEPSRKLIWNWHLDAICEHLEAVTDGLISRLLINIIPGGMKSLLLNVFWPAWEWGPRKRPSNRYVKASYAQTLTVRDNRKLRRLVLSPEYQQNWRVSLVADENNKIKFETAQTGWSLATSVEGVGTGERGDRVLIDDPHNVKEGESEAVREATVQTWFKEVVPTRMDDPEHSVIVVIMQRVHERDVSGFILANDLGYQHLMFPMKYEVERRCFTSLPRGRGALARYVGSRQRWLPEGWAPKRPEELLLKPEYDRATPQFVYPQDRRTREGELLFPARFPAHVVARDEKVMGGAESYAVVGQMQQRPSPRGGLMFKRDAFRIVSTLPAGHFVWVRHFDLAATKVRVLGQGARTAGLLMGYHAQTRGYYVADCRWMQDEGDEVLEFIKNTAAEDRLRFGRVELSLPQDPGQAGKVQAKNFVKEFAGRVVSVERETGDKVERAEPVKSQADAGNVFLLEGPWVPEFLDEVGKFPTGARKDTVDAMSGAFGRLITRRSGETSSGAMLGGY